MSQIYSVWLRIIVEIERAADHAWRKITGFPTLRRSVITPYLYLGGQYKIRRISLLKKLGVSGIVSMRTSDILGKESLKDFHLLHLPTPDQEAPTIKQLEDGIKFIKGQIENKGKVYIHCKHGEGRGPSMAIAYLISTGMTFEDAFNLVKKVRPFIRPTAAQIERLIELQKKLKKQKK